MTVRIQLRRDSEANWIAANPILAEGEAAFSLDKNRVKIGDGNTIWSSLEYVGAEDKTPELMALINKNTQDITNETAARQSGDAALGGQIMNESAARSEADNELSGRIKALEDNPDPGVPEGLVEQVGNNTNAINNQAEAISNNTTAINNQADAISTNAENIGKLDGRVETLEGTKYVPLPNGILEEFRDTDYLLIGRTDPNSGTTPTYLTTWASIKEELGSGGGNPGGPGLEALFCWKYAGQTYWPDNIQPGELWLHPAKDAIFIHDENIDGVDLSEEIAAFFVKNSSILLTGTVEDWLPDKHKWVNAIVNQDPQDQGKWYNFPIRVVSQGSGATLWKVGEEVHITVDVSQASRPDADEAMETLTETVAKMKKEITSLKTSLTKIRKSVNGSD